MEILKGPGSTAFGQGGNGGGIINVVTKRPYDWFGAEVSFTRGGWDGFDADTGKLKLLLLPTGQHAGNTMTSWLFALHEANVFGLPYRFFVCLLGLAIVMLSVTGIVIWLKKRRAR
ncbi:putative iron-regulated membrane protein [Methylocaldum marinum]|uniref:Putative iron-regulated membrane protein n=1 Tax=Methylocaldum marinum TaxID=1432792 RepID=A0A286P3B6_9GAMM|nr:PepSY-associated TM helix domain-containing protein [Methylocaldum marinum]BBA32138.1 putative iron-regulated membrane protein [Methylocaldum marinum]